MTVQRLLDLDRVLRVGRRVDRLVVELGRGLALGLALGLTPGFVVVVRVFGRTEEGRVFLGRVFFFRTALRLRTWLRLMLVKRFWSDLLRFLSPLDRVYCLSK